MFAWRYLRRRDPRSSYRCLANERSPIRMTESFSKLTCLNLREELGGEKRLGEGGGPLVSKLFLKCYTCRDVSL